MAGLLDALGMQNALTQDYYTAKEAWMREEVRRQQAMACGALQQVANTGGGPFPIKQDPSTNPILLLTGEDE